jgi:glycosyltransferase involved in cell wall biosynthesis
MNNNTLYIVMPAYNEDGNIRDVVSQWHPIVEKIGGDSRLVIFNDGSKDNTYERMQELQQHYPLFVAETKPNSGHGATCLYAYRYALEHGADYVFQTDSDGQTNPDEFWKFWEQRASYNILIGSRLHRKDGLARVVVMLVLKIIVKVIFGVWVVDANTPFRMMSKDFLKKFMGIIPMDFFLPNAAMTAAAVKWKYSIFWSPIAFKPRQKGTNSITLKRIFKIGIKALGDFRRVNKRLNIAHTNI